MSCNITDLSCKPMFAALTNNCRAPELAGIRANNTQFVNGINACDNYFNNQYNHFQDLMNGLTNKIPDNTCLKSNNLQKTLQKGGAFSVFPSALDVDMNDPVYNQCETVVHLTPSYLEGPTYGNLATRYNLQTNFRPSKQPDLNVSTVRPVSSPQTGPYMQTSLCGDRQRCGNGACAPTQNPSLNSCKTGCKKICLPNSCAWDNRVLTSPWVYGQGTADIQTYYLDLSSETIGARPLVRAGTNNSIPPMMLINQTNLLGKQFGCRQPCWQNNCL